LKALPMVQQRLNSEKESIKKTIGDKLAVPQETVLVIPPQGLSPEEVLKRMKELKSLDEKNWKGGKVSGVIYSGDEKLTALMNEAYSLFSLTNPLHPEIFPSIRKFEAEIIRMTANMMNGDSEVCGAVTSGGTESILMAVKTYREQFKKQNPEIVIPVTAHAAFDKAGNYFGVKVVHVRLDKDFKVDVKALESAITKNTIMIMGSAPQYSSGVVDPIPELAAIALKHGIGMHVDSCLGGYVLPWVQKSGVDKGKIPFFDFRVPGVTSMSVDTHKYGYATKGTSVILFKNEDLRKHVLCAT
jgi:sphinganine-1-phosphate aldolase